MHINTNIHTYIHTYMNTYVSIHISEASSRTGQSNECIRHNDAILQDV